MDDRSDRIQLDPREARCSAGSCTAAAKCARRKAAIPHAWGKVSDYSLPEVGGVAAGTALCSGFINVASLPVQPKQDARRTHPPMEDGHG